MNKEEFYDELAKLLHHFVDAEYDRNSLNYNDLNIIGAFKELAWFIDEFYTKNKQENKDDSSRV